MRSKETRLNLLPQLLLLPCPQDQMQAESWVAAMAAAGPTLTRPSQPRDPRYSCKGSFPLHDLPAPPCPALPWPPAEWPACSTHLWEWTHVPTSGEGPAGDQVGGSRFDGPWEAGVSGRAAVWLL